MKKANKGLFIIFVCWSLFFAGCDFSGGRPGAENADKPPVPKVLLKVYRADQNVEWLVAETLEREAAAGKAEDLALALLVGEKPKDSKLVNIFPPGVKVRSLKIENGLATADFSGELLKPATGGSSYEMLLVGSIINTLTEFPAVKAVQITVEGQKTGTINGHMDILDPLQRNESLIKKN